MKRSAPILAAALLAASSCRNATPSAALALGSRSPDGAIGIDDQQVAAKNSVETLGLDGSSATLDARIDLAIETRRPSHLAMKGFWSSHDGSGTLDEDFAKGSLTIPAGTSVESELDVGLVSVVWTFDLAERDDLEAALGFGLAWLDVQAGFTSSQNGDEIFTDESVPVPLAAGRVAWGADRWSLTLELAGIDVGYAGDHATFADLDVAARWRFLGRRFGRHGELVVGWRELYAGVDYDEDLEAVEASVSLGGPYFGLGFRF